MTDGKTHSICGSLHENAGYILVFFALFVVAFGELYIGITIHRTVEHLRAEQIAKSRLYRADLERKQRRLAALLSHLEANPQVMAPAIHQSVIGPRAKMEWKYSTTGHGADQLSRKDSTLATQIAKMLLKSNRSAVTGETTITRQDDHRDKDIAQYSPKQSIIEIRDAADPLNKDKTKMAQVTGEAAWYPITLSEKLGDGGTFLWRVIEGERDTSGTLRAEGSWGPYSVFTIYPSAYERIRATRKIRIGSYNVAQLPIEKEFSGRKDFCVNSFEPFDGLSVNETNVLCGVINSMRSSGTPDLKPVVRRYSNIDDKLLVDLKAGELDLAFGNISKAAYRKGKGIHFVEYAQSTSVFLTNDEKKKRIKKIGHEDKICAVQGTVYDHVLGEIRKKKPDRYTIEVCQNTIDAIDRLLKDDIQWVVMMGDETWKKEIEPKHGDKLYRNTEVELENGKVPEEYKIEGDAFAITDLGLLRVICRELGEKNLDCQTLVPPNSQKGEVSSRVGS